MQYSTKLVIIFCLMCTAKGADDFRFPESALDFRRTPNITGIRRHQSHNEPRQIPLDLIHRLNSIEDEAELRQFMDPHYLATADEDLIGNRFGEGDIEVVKPKGARCKPEMQTVSLADPTDPTLYYFPSCTRVNRCGGCCSSDLLSCQPTKQVTVNYQVVILQYGGSDMMRPKDKEIVSVEEHIECKCDCIIKEKDCNKLQQYNSGGCRCMCLNIDDQKECQLNNDTKIWNPRTCICSCRDTQECSTNYFFNPASCSCTRIPKP